MRGLGVLLLAVSTLTGCSGPADHSVLFVGNSYTSSNDMPGMVRQLADSADVSVEVASHAPGGWWWRDHADSQDTIDLLRSGDFDTVVLQEQSMAPASADHASKVVRPNGVALAVRAIEGGARVVLFQTWGHRDGNGDIGHSSYESMQVAVFATYAEVANAVAGRLAPVGAAWWITRSERPDIGLYEPDGSHPSEAGSYLAAAVIASTVTGVDAVEFEADLGLSSDVAEALRGFASRAVGGEIPWRR